MRPRRACAHTSGSSASISPVRTARVARPDDHRRCPRHHAAIDREERQTGKGEPQGRQVRPDEQGGAGRHTAGDEPLAQREGGLVLTVDLESQEIRGAGDDAIAFEIDPFRKHCLLNGLDDIGLSLEKVSSIDSFETKQAQSQPWL